MILYLVRHGAAVNVGEEGVKFDPDRMLTEHGKDRTKSIATQMARIEAVPELIISSPFRRAIETAGIMRAVLGADIEMATNDLLEPDVPCSGAVACLAGIEKNSIMIVGHMPLMAEMAAYFISERGDAQLHFRKSAVACIEFDGHIIRGEGRLEWLINPRLMV